MKNQTPTILVIEDEKSLLKVWVEKFQEDGLKVLTAPDGASALQTAFENHPDLIVVDLVMPSSDGLHVIKKLREDKWGSSVPVMFLNSWRDPQSMQGPAGTAEHLGNWNLEQVVSKVEKKLEILKMGIA